MSRKLSLYKTASFLLITLALLTERAIPTSSCSTDESYSEVLSEVSASLHLSAERMPLFITRRSDLETEILDLEYIVKGDRLKKEERIHAIEVLDLKREGYLVQDGHVREAVVDLDDAPTWRVGYERDSHKIFHLAGFEDNRQGFNDLMGELTLRIDSNELALAAHSTFVKLTHTDSVGAVVGDELDLMKAALANYAGRRTQKSFSDFWLKCPLNVKRRISPPRTSAVPGGVGVIFFSDIGQTVRQESILIAKDGTVQKQTSEKLFSWTHQ